jgi:hypothetical protein
MRSILGSGRIRGHFADLSVEWGMSDPPRSIVPIHR